MSVALRRVLDPPGAAAGERRFRIGLAVLALLALGWVAWSLIGLAGPRVAPRALVAADGWTASGDFAPAAPDSPQIAIDPSIVRDPAFRYWQAYAPDGRALRGQLVSAPFPPPRFLAVPYGGFPEEVAGNRIVLHCVSTGAEHPVSRVRMNDGRATSYLALPPEFCQGDIRLVASVDGKPPIGVGTPFAVSEASYLAETAMLPRALVVVATWIGAWLLWFVSAFVVARLSPHVGAVSAGMIGGAIAGMALIAAFEFGPATGIAAVWAIAVATVVGAVAILVRGREEAAAFLGETWLPAALWLAFSLFAAAVVTAADNGGGSWWINALFTPLRWSSDNQLPFLLAEALLRGDPPASIRWGPWLASDRTPLLSGLLLASRVLIAHRAERMFGPTFVPIAYMMSAIVFLSTWVAVVVEAIRRVDVRLLPVSFLTAATTPFLFFNSVYAWPKLLGGAYVLVAFTILFELSRRQARDRGAIVAVALAAAAACLAHSSNAFGLVPVALVFLPTIWRQGLVANLVAFAAALALASPWLYWQLVLQPGGNALIRFALAYDFEAERRDRTLLASMQRAYGWQTLPGWLEDKRSTLAVMLGLENSGFGTSEMARNSAGAGAFGTARVHDFLSVGHSLFMAAIGLVAVPFMALYRAGSEQAAAFARRAALAGLAGILFGVLVMLPPGVTHHQPYGSLLLLVVAGGLAVAAAPPIVAAGATLVATAYFGLVWVWHPIAIATTVQGSAVALVVWSAAAALWLLFARPRRSA